MMRFEATPRAYWVLAAQRTTLPGDRSGAEVSGLSKLPPSASTTVTSVALSNGFFQLARFSAYYFTAFAETPSQTFRRGRLRARRGADDPR
jgi:AraC-like DNA-binding protein